MAPRAVLGVALLAAVAMGVSGAAAAAPVSELDPLTLRGRAPVHGQPLVAVLCYHDVSTDSVLARDTVTPEELRGHIRALRAGGWKFRTLGQVLDARAAGERLPTRTVVLTFDDGYRSFLTRALPVLREEKVPAGLAVITSFVDQPPVEMPPLLTWDELRQLQAGGQVEILSHSHALHRHEAANPQGLAAPAATTRLYRLELGRYETRDEYRDRILADLVRSRARLREELGIEARVLAWPYGEHNRVARELAVEAGFEATVGLEGAPVIAADLEAGYLSRVLVTRSETIGAPDLAWLFPSRKPGIPAEVDLDALVDADAERTVENVEAAIRNLWDRGATDVFLSVCADPTRAGYLEETYFMNHQTRVRADVWSMIAIRMKRAGFRVWAKVPALSLAWEWARHPEWRLESAPVPAGAGGDRHAFRLSPELPEVESAAADFLNDLAVYAPVDGIVFDRDTRLDAGDRLRTAPEATAAEKARVMERFLDRLERTVLAWRPHCEIARVRAAAVAGGPETAAGAPGR